MIVTFPSNDIDTTGSTDVSVEVGQWLRSIPQGTPDERVTVKFPWLGQLWVESGLFLRGAAWWTIKPQLCRLFTKTDGTNAERPAGRKVHPKWPRGRAHLALYEPIGVVIDGDFRIDSIRQRGERFRGAFEAQHAIELFDPVWCVIDQPIVRGVYGDGIFVGGSGGFQVVVIRNPRGRVMRDLGRQGIGVNNGAVLRVNDVKIDGTARAILDLEPYGRAGMTIDDVEMRGGWSRGNGLNFVAAANEGIGDVGIYDHVTDRLEIVLRSNGTVALDNLHGTRTLGQDGPAIEVRAAECAAVTGCSQPLIEGRSETLVGIGDVDHWIVKDNDIPIMRRNANTRPVDPPRQGEQVVPL